MRTLGFVARAIPGIALSTLFGCGGGSSPSAPSQSSTPSPTPSQLIFVDGLNHAKPIGGLNVLTGAPGTPPVTDASGVVSFLLARGAAVTTTGKQTSSPGYFDRETKFTGEATFFQWPVAPYWNAAYVQKLVYDYTGGGEETDTTYDYLWRLQPGSYTVSVSSDISNNQAMLDQVNLAVDRGAALASEGGISISWAKPGAAANITFEIETDSAHPVLGVNWGATVINGLRGAIHGGRVVLRPEIAGSTDVAIHEMGHVLGFQHSSDRRDVMYVDDGRDEHQTDYSPNEKATWFMMSQRSAGNRFPDRDPSVAGAARGGRPPVIRCVRSAIVRP